VPEGWEQVSATGPGPFVTHVVLRSPDGATVEWSSRRHRKRLGLRSGDTAPPSMAGLRRASPMSWWIGSLFMVGSACFALGSFPAYFDNVEPRTVGLTFFVGSIFFTSAAYLQYRESVAAPAGIHRDGPRPRGLRGLVGWRPHRLDWWATTVQLVGTLFFNLSTFAATRTDLTLEQERRLIWAPDVWGSICFLVASWLAWSEVSPRRSTLTGRGVSWWIAGLNLLGSVAFGASAIAARYVGTDGDVANITLVNLGTFAGALCFFVGAALLPVESGERESA
jgi:hypothetical protein